MLPILRALIVVLLVVAPASAEQRVALVVGNNAYRNLGADARLTRAVNDMEAVAVGLEKIGFSVVRAPDVDRATLLARLDELTTKVGPGDTAVFFYAGHGVAVDGVNYLLPVDAPDRASERVMTASAVSEPEIVSALSERGVKVAIVVLDACRNNPFAGDTRAIGATRGLARLPVEPPGVFGIYSAASGQTALDRLGPDDTNPNSVFTRIFVKELTAEGGSLIDVAYRLQKEVAELAATVGHDQRPTYYDQARGRDIRLTDLPTTPKDLAPPAVIAAVEAEAAAKVAPAAAVAAMAAESREMDAVPAGGCAAAADHFKAAMQLRLKAAFEDHVARFPGCPFATVAKLMADQPDGRTTGAGAAPAVAPAAPTLGTLVSTLKGPRERIDGVAVSPDSRLVAAAAHDASVRVWDMASGEIVHRFERLGKPAYSVAFSPDGKRLAAGLWNHTIRIWTLADGKLEHTLKGHADEVYSVVFSADGSTLFSASEDRTIRSWDVAAGKETGVMRGLPGKATALALAPDGETLAVAASDRLVRLRSTATGEALRPIGEQGGTIYALAFSPDGTVLASGATDHVVRLWDAETGRIIRDLVGHADEVYGVAFSPDGRLVASASEDRTVIVWDAATGERLATLKGHTGIVQAVAFSPDGRHLVSGGRDRTVRIWSLGERSAVATTR